MLGVGDAAPDFDVLQPDGSSRPLSSYRGHPVILFFFPKANTTGCTIETRGFAERYESFRNAGFEVVGVSVDSGETQVAFAAKCGSKFPMVGDPSKSIATAYGVLGWMGVARRVTFLVDGEGTIRQVVEGLLPTPHLKAAEEWTGQPTRASTK
ncbi:MAG TPA: peroxiredoxin [Thermoplasmata archaeon]|nr:peroxiredoxin [Thermoplasmata archaeon]